MTLCRKHNCTNYKVKSLRSLSSSNAGMGGAPGEEQSRPAPHQEVVAVRAARPRGGRRPRGRRKEEGPQGQEVLQERPNAQGEVSSTIPINNRI